jgi:DNA-binding transcriptional ArsR family regulator
MSKKSMMTKTIFAINNRELSNILIGRKGGKTTIMIIDKLLSKPYNANELSKLLHLDYKTITHHIDIIYEHNYVEREELENCILYYPSNKLFNCLDEYNLIKKFLETDK